MFARPAIVILLLFCALGTAQNSEKKLSVEDARKLKILFHVLLYDGRYYSYLLETFDLDPDTLAG